MNNHNSQSVPREIPARVALVEHILSQGNCISVHDGGGWALLRSTDKKSIIEVIESVDECHVRAYESASATKSLGTFYLVLGNHPSEDIADHTDNAYCQAVCESISTAEELQ
jgi:DNA-binding IscR family transcriptional regulator